MKAKGFVPSSKSYNPLVNSLTLEGEVDEAVSYLREMIGNQRSAALPISLCFISFPHSRGVEMR